MKILKNIVHQYKRLQRFLMHRSIQEQKAVYAYLMADEAEKHCAAIYYRTRDLTIRFLQIDCIAIATLAVHEMGESNRIRVQPVCGF